MSLAVLGVSAREERVYRALLVRGTIDLPALARTSGLDPATCRRALDGLLSHHLLELDGDSVLGVRVRLPSLALAELSQRCAERLGDELVRIAAVQAECLALDELARESAAQSAGGDGTAPFDVVRGELDVRRVMEHLAHETKFSVDSITEASRTPQQIHDSPDNSRSFRRGVAMRWLVHRDMLSLARYRQRVREVTESGGQVRAVARPLTRLLIADRVTALVPDDHADPRSGLVVVRHPVVVGRLAELFETSWSAAQPVAADGTTAAEPGSGFGESERQLLHALAAYPTDEQVARALSISVRQVQRRIKDVFGDLGAVNRFHAGVLAERLGLVPDQDEDEADAG